MPQMAPMMWSILYSFFLVIFMMFFVLNYFISPYKSLSSPKLTLKFIPKLWKL
uniref:ATP synthase F0 subunit 8 n=2 Tax=Matutidae TaxID=761932 RepID=A0A068W6H1_ASHLU|nr:ATP synthase F0 subunit 8 [Ashtoret lunaris]YP_010021627.1 ATP synthase F0 subunit 8 [Matuta victor]QOL10568.1 ATP synthase F0 subunit 8 [Matuta victor]CDR98372.1 ATP synthase F0 subunit 8 [Ashtoret lunaris]